MRTLMTLMLLGSIATAAPLKIMCWNLQHGVGEDGKLDLQRVADRIVAEKPDLVALQEVDRNCTRSGVVDQATELGRLTGMASIFGKALNLDEGEYGQAVLSRLPMVTHKVHPLPGEGEPRIALEVHVKDADRELVFVTVHLDHQSAAARIAQANEILKVLEGDSPAILCGDFNDGPKSETLAAFTAPWTIVPKDGPPLTFPAAKPTVEIDFLLIRGLEIVTNARVLDDNISSDHRPLVMTVK